MHNNISYLGPKENEFLMEFASSGKNIFTSKEAVEFWGTPHNTKIALYRLTRKGWLKHIERGKYVIIPFEAGKLREWSEDSYLIGSELVNPAAIAYWSAIHHWNWTEQIPRTVYIQTTRRKSKSFYEVFGVRYEFVTVKEKKFYGHVKEWRNGKAVLITDREKTLIDCADDVERGGGIEELIKAVKSAFPELSLQKLNEYCIRFPNGAVKKRLGFLLETVLPVHSPELEHILKAWRNSLSEGIIPLRTKGTKSGKIISRWRILNNTVNK